MDNKDFFNINSLIHSYKNIGMIITDKTGKILFANEMIKNALEFDCLGISLNKIVPSIKLENILTNNMAINGMRVFIRNHKFLCNFFSITLSELYGVATFYDCESLKQIENKFIEYKDLAKQLETILNSSYDGIYITDGKGVTIRANLAYEKITGIKASELIGQHMERLVTKGYFSESVSLNVIKNRKSETIIQKLRNGKKIMCTGSPVFNEQGDIDMIITNVRDITELTDLQHKLLNKEALNAKYSQELMSMYPENIVIKSKNMIKVFEYAKQVAPFPTPILLTGASGVGKEVVASFIHNNSKRKDKPFIKINCGAIPEHLLESELFGYERGAFTGAKKEGKPGLFEMADEGTILLDEIGELPLNLQVKLLRTLQESRIMRIGGVNSKKIDVRVISVTNRDLKEMLEKNTFRKDLYYRLNVIEINIPSLRERKDDIIAISDYYLKKYCNNYGLYKEMTNEVKECFVAYDWPGNIRELKNLVENLVVSSNTDKITLSHLPSHMVSCIDYSLINHTSNLNKTISLSDAIKNYEKKLIEEALCSEKTVRGAAKTLGIHHSTLSRKIKKYDIKLEF